MKYLALCASNSQNYEKNDFMPKIAVVIPKYGLVGGAEQFASELTGQLCNRTAYTFQVFANRWKGSAGTITFQKIPIISFPKFLTTVSFAWFARRLIRKSQFDLVHSHERIFEADIFTLHGIPHRYWIEQVRKKKLMSLYDLATAWVEKKLVMESRCKKFVAVSELTRQIFLKEYPVDPARVAVIHPGIHLSSLPPENHCNRRASVRKELKIGPDEIAIIFASMNFEIKGLDDILGALGRFRRQSGNFKLIVAGKGDFSKYKKLALVAGIADHVVFTGILGRDAMNDMYRAGDFYVMLSKFDTFGMVVLEAMAFGLPVIVSDRVGAKDLVVDGKNGFVVSDTHDHEFIASKIQCLFDKDTRRHMSDAAYATASQNTWERVTAQYADLYGGILGT